MNRDEAMIEAFEQRANRRVERREFFRTSAAAIGGASLLAACFDDDRDISQPEPSPTPTPTPDTLTDAEILNFALNLEYLEAQFYTFAAFGEGLPLSALGGVGTQGEVKGGRAVNFSDPAVRLYAREVALDERAHVLFLRQALGVAAVSQPPLDISAAGAFTQAARAAGLVTANQTFDPYASDENFLLGAYIFEDVGVTAYKGASPLLSSKVFLEAAAGILATEAYHAGLIRTTLYGKGVQTPALRDATEAISDARDSLDGPADKDQGIRPRGNASNVVVADANAVAFSRTPSNVLNIVYLTKMMATKGGFFPSGVNGSIRSSSNFG